MELCEVVPLTYLSSVGLVDIVFAWGIMGSKNKKNK